MISKSLATTAELILSAKPDSSNFFWKKKKLALTVNIPQGRSSGKTKHAHPHRSIEQQIKDSLIYSKK